MRQSIKSRFIVLSVIKQPKQHKKSNLLWEVEVDPNDDEEEEGDGDEDSKCDLGPLHS